MLFSERVATLTWLRRELPQRLSLPDDAFAVLHGGLPDDRQMAVVEVFQRATTPLRVLITGDVASEGVNLHKQCHHLVHVDIPWSLIRIEQRNGRIDRYGQLHPPQIVALALTTTEEKFSGDVRVLTRLLAKEHAAHTALGDAASLLRLHDVGREEDEIRRALASGKALDEVVPDPTPLDELTDDIDDGDAEFDAFFASLGQDVAPPPPVVDRRGLFDREVDFLREALHEAFLNPAARYASGGIGWAEHPEEGLVELVPPPDLMTRLNVLPQGYLAQRKVREKLLLAVTPEAGTESLRRATQGTAPGDQSTQWPQAHYLSPLHPVLDWAVDRALTRLGRNQVPVATAAVGAPTALVLGTLTNQRGQVVLRAVVGMEFFAPGVDPIIHQDVAELLQAAGFRTGAVNPGVPLDLAEHQSLVPAAVAQMRRYMAALKQERASTLSDAVEGGGPRHCRMAHAVRGVSRPARARPGRAGAAPHRAARRPSPRARPVPQRPRRTDGARAAPAAAERSCEVSRFDSIVVGNDLVSEHWLAEQFPATVKTLRAGWKEREEHSKTTPRSGLLALSATFGAELVRLRENADVDRLRALHASVREAMQIPGEEAGWSSERAGKEMTVPAVASLTPSGTHLLVVQARDAETVEDLLDGAGAGHLLSPATVDGAEETSTARVISGVFRTGEPPALVLVTAGAWLLLAERGSWPEGRWLAVDLATALERRDTRAAGELETIAALVSGDSLLPGDDGNALLLTLLAESVKHAVGVSKDLRNGVRESIELLATEVLRRRRARELPSDQPGLAADLTRQSLRYLYRILFLLYAEARPELGVLPVGTTEYAEGYGLDRLRELVLTELTSAAAGSGTHLYESLGVLFRLVNDGYPPETLGPDGVVAPSPDDEGGLRFEALRADLFSRDATALIDEVGLGNRCLQQVLGRLLLSRQQRGRDRGFVSYAQLGINQLGAVYEGLMSYSGSIASEHLVEVAKDGDRGKGGDALPGGDGAGLAGPGSGRLGDRGVGPA